MTEESSARPVPVPSGQIGRAVRLSGLAAGIAGRAALGSGRAVLSGQRPDLPSLLITPANARRIAERLAEMRGAAMKIGQLMSMETGDMLPPEMAAILARLRADAHFMPPKQLKQVLARAWGPGFPSLFRQFDVRPVAAASIGQVHRAITKDGEVLAIKVQYPGVTRAIDSDVRNVGLLLRMSGLVPEGVDITSLLEEARQQLHDEADYLREAAALRRFGNHLSGDPAFRVPRVHDALTTASVLAMDYIDSRPIEEMCAAPQEVRDRIAARLIDLILRELFDLREMQTDPNFANFRWDPVTEQLVLLDFGAVRSFPEAMTDDYRRLLRAGLEGDRDGARAVMERLGFFGPQGVTEAQAAQMLDMFEMGMALVRSPSYDFARCDLAERMRARAMVLSRDRAFAPVPPVDTLFLQRKFAGMYLLIRRLGARVDMSASVARWA